MSELTFEKTISDLEITLTCLDIANAHNDIIFRKICKEIFQKSYAKLETQKTLDVGAKMLGVGIASLIKIASKNYQKDFFKNSIQRINNESNLVSNSEMALIFSILDNSEISLVMKLVKIHNKFGLSETISWINSCN